MNIRNQCCGVILLVIISIFYHQQKKVKLNSQKVFFAILCVTMFSVLMDISSLVGIYYMDVLPIWVVKTICKTYLSTLILVGCTALLYTYEDLHNISQENRTYLRFFSGVAMVGIVLLFCLPIKIHAGGATDVYTYGPSVLVTYAFAASFLAAILIRVQRKKEQMNPRRRQAILLWLFVWIIATIVQFIRNDILIVGYASCIGVMLLYLKLENPESDLDRETGLFNHSALMQYMRQLLVKEEPFSMLVMTFRRSVNNCMYTENMETVTIELIKYLNQIDGMHSFKNDKDEYIMLFKDALYAEETLARLQKRFEFGWGDDGAIFLVPDFMFLPDSDIVESVDDVMNLLHYARKQKRDNSDNDVLRMKADMVAKMKQESQVEELLSNAIENDWVEVFYQPIYSTKDQAFTCAEALVRIRDEDGKIVPPGVFIDVAEQNGKILQLGEMVFDKVCRFLQEHDPDELGIHYIEVNLSVVQCAFEHLADNYIQIMEKYGINPKYINLEITESASVEAKKNLLENMRILMEYGVKFALDDFGTGQSNLNYIVDMPVQIVKFDRNMCTAYFENGKAKYVMDAAMHMIHGMKLEIVSEGIETEEQYNTMEQLQISYIQGYYFSKPLDEQMFLEFIEQHRHKWIEG